MQLCSFVTVVYEYMYRSLWLNASQTWLPNMEIFMLRIFMFLFIGMSCLWWIWRRDVVASWASCCSSCIGIWRPGAKAETPPPNLYPDVSYHVQPQVHNNDDCYLFVPLKLILFFRLMPTTLQSCQIKATEDKKKGEFFQIF